MRRSPRFLMAAVVVCIVLVVGIGLGVVYFHPASTTQPVPPTQTTCPQAGRARAAITAPLALGTHQNVVYFTNEKGGGVTEPGWVGVLQRYDTTTGKKTVIVKAPYLYFEHAQVSPDGQWILFVASRFYKQGEMDELRMVRIDGQGLQTLYCFYRETHATAFFPPIAWSPDQKLLAFTIHDLETGGDTIWHVYLLDLANGELQPEMVPQMDSNSPSAPIYLPSKWLDNTRFYVTSLTSSPPPPLGPMMYLLDTKHGSNQRIDDLQQVVDVPNTQSCWDYDISPNATNLFTSQCSGTWDNPGSPSTISVQPATGGPSRIIYSSSTLVVTTIRVVNNSFLLFWTRSTNGNPNQDEVWKINTDGSSLTQLSRDISVVISRDGRMYASSIHNPQSKSTSLMFGSLMGGIPTTFASDPDGNGLFEIVGWTTM